MILGLVLTFVLCAGSVVLAQNSNMNGNMSNGNMGNGNSNQKK